MSIANYVSVTITRDSVGLDRAGFGVPLLLSANAGWVERVRSYTSLAGVITDFGATSVEAAAAALLFGQTPRLQTLKIGRLANKPTQRYSIAVGTPINAHTYSFTVEGEGFGPETVTTAATDGSATNDETVALIVTALNAVVGNNYTASAVGGAGSQTVQIVADAAADWFSIQIADANIGEVTISQNHADPGVAADLTAIANEDNDWYFVVCPYNSKLMAAAIAAHVNTLDKMYVCTCNDTTIATVAVASGDDIGEDFFDLGYTKSTVWYHPNPAEFLGEAVVGRIAPLDPGKVVAGLKTLSGVTAVTRTDTHRANIVARKANSYERVAGRSMTFNGTVASGEWMDVIRDLAYHVDDMQKSVLETLADADKVPFTDEGIAMVEAAMRASMERAEAAGVYAAGWTVTVPKAADVSPADKANRTLPDLKFNATLAGAIQGGEVLGVVSV